MKSQSHRSPQQQQAQQSQQVAAYLRQIYQVFATDAVRLYQASSDHCIGAELFSAAHAVLQDRHLRGDEVDISGLKDVLQSSVRLVSQYQASSSIELPLKSAYNSLLFTYGEYYNDNHSYFRPVSLLVF